MILWAVKKYYLWKLRWISFQVTVNLWTLRVIADELQEFLDAHPQAE